MEQKLKQAKIKALASLLGQVGLTIDDVILLIQEITEQPVEKTIDKKEK